MAKDSQDGPRALVERAVAGDRVAVAKLISIVEDGGSDIGEVMEELFRHTGNAYTIGVTGSPGAGKSTLVQELVGRMRGEDLRVAVLAVDPSSPFTGGALLGDRVRMQNHSVDPGVFIRSMATRGHLGGLALATPEAVRVLDAAGNDYVVVETVGVGQAEIDIMQEADSVVIVLNPGWGDSVQAGKAGLLEIGDIFVINKADREGTKQAVREIEQMIHFGPHRAWTPPVRTTVATSGDGVDELWMMIKAHRAFLEREGELEARRRARISKEISDIVAARVKAQVERDAQSQLEEMVARVERREIDPYAAAEELMGKLAIDGK